MPTRRLLLAFILSLMCWLTAAAETEIPQFPWRAELPQELERRLAEAQAAIESLRSDVSGSWDLVLDERVHAKRAAIGHLILSRSPGQDGLTATLSIDGRRFAGQAELRGRELHYRLTEARGITGRLQHLLAKPNAPVREATLQLSPSGIRLEGSYRITDEGNNASHMEVYARELPELVRHFDELSRLLRISEEVWAAGGAVERLGFGGSPSDAERTKVLRLLAEMDRKGLLEATLHNAAGVGLITDEEERMAANMVRAELWTRGLAPGRSEEDYQDWETLGREHLGLARTSNVFPSGPSRPPLFEDPRFVAELEGLTDAPFRDGGRARPLIDGPASFALRDQLIAGARDRIDLMSWAIYDDYTGRSAAEQLIAKARQGVKVRVLVDGQMAETKRFGPVLAKLEAAGIDVLRWRDPERPFDGNHRKLLVVDGRDAIAGGMNIGDEYSHRRLSETPGWRDTDIHVQGPAVADAERLFADVWNEQIKKQSLKLKPMDLSAPSPMAPNPIGATERVAVVNHTPGEDAHLMLAHLKAIEGATRRIDIEHGYFMRLPAIHDALLAALSRGVKLRVLVNSEESLGEADAIMSEPILNNARDLVVAGAEVYLKQGAQLHSKFMVVDGIFSCVGSYNLHPRSYRYEGELAVLALGRDTAAALTEAFEKDIAAARPTRKPEEVHPSGNPLSHLAMDLFPNQL